MFGQMKTNTQMIKIKTIKIKKRRILYWTSFRTVDITGVFSYRQNAKISTAKGNAISELPVVRELPPRA